MISRLPNTIRSTTTPLSPSLHFHRPIHTPISLSSSPQHHPTPLFLRPLTYSATTPDLLSFHNWAKSLALSSPSLFPSSSSSSPPDPAHLIRQLTWLLQDATSQPSIQFPHLGSSQLGGTIHLRVSLEELYLLWKQRVEERRPFQYIVGCEHWRDLVVAVKEGVLIPRPETEMVVDMVGEVEGFERGLWADLGTGSGAIAVGIGRSLVEGGKVFATDLSPVAVEVARFNVERYGLKDKVEIRQGSWFEPLQDVKGKLTGLVSNPPYIPSSHISGLQAEVGRHEPRLALDGGNDGMDYLLHLCEGSTSALKPGGFFAFETNGDKQSEYIADFMSTKWGDCFRDVKTVLDFAGIKRFVTGFRR